MAAHHLIANLFISRHGKGEVRVDAAVQRVQRPRAGLRRRWLFRRHVPLQQRLHRRLHHQPGEIRCLIPNVYRPIGLEYILVVWLFLVPIC